MIARPMPDQPDIIAEELVGDDQGEDDAAAAVALARRLSGILRRPVEAKPADGHGRSQTLEVDGSGSTAGR